MRITVDPSELYRIIYTDHPDPFEVLGAHAVEIDGQAGLIIRAFLPDASEAFVLEGPPGAEKPVRHRMTLLHPYGFFEVFLPGRQRSAFQYELERLDEFGRRERFQDSYAFEPGLTDFDLYLFGQGKNYRIFEKLGAHKVTVEGVGGVRFAVWAPNARSVSVIGSFNGWDRRLHAMRRLTCGVWEIFVPGLDEGVAYKYQIKTHQDVVLDKADPYATRAQTAPRTASLVHQLGRYEWQDQAWLAKREKWELRSSAMSIYEVHLGSWLMAWDPVLKENRPIGFKALIEKLVPYVVELGYTHVEFLPVMEHPFGGSWGYQVTGYYAPHSKLGRPEELMALIDAFHQAGIGVILDWVPAHFPKDAHALGRFDGTAVYEHMDPRLGEHQDWGTYIFNFGKNEVRNFLVGSALFWLEYYHIDGLRVDAITSMLYLNYSRQPGQWLPNKYGGPENLEAVDFLRELCEVVRQYHPGTFVTAEESTSWPGVTRASHLGGLGFDFKWNMGWMNDTLSYLATDPIHRKFQHQKLTFSIWYAFNEAFILPLSHDEVVHLKRSLIGKMPGETWMKAAGLRLLLGYQYGHPGKKLLFMGGELGQWREWNHDRSLDWFVLNDPAHEGIRRFVMELNRLYREQPALWELDGSSDGFEWIDFADANRSIIAFMRKGNEALRETVLLVYNFTPVPRFGYRLGVEHPGVYLELLNSDGEAYGGQNIGNYGRVEAQAVPMHDRPYSLSLNLPPLSVLVLKRVVPPKFELEPLAEPAQALVIGATSDAGKGGEPEADAGTDAEDAPAPTIVATRALTAAEAGGEPATGAESVAAAEPAASPAPAKASPRTPARKPAGRPAVKPDGKAGSRSTTSSPRSTAGASKGRGKA